jgi:hypothetical protein
MSTQIATVFSKNRAEELGYDVWQHFVIPPFYHQLDLTTARKPRIIVGGRGCGKTMLLRYLSHQSMFSPKRPTVPEEALLHIGLYWRADTQFASAMNRRNIEAETWEGAFNHMAALLLGLEVLGSLRSIAESACAALTLSDLDNLNFSRLAAFDKSLPAGFNALHLKLQEALWAFEAWVSDPRKHDQPPFLPGPRFILALIGEIKAMIKSLNDAVFFVYMDEYENLSVYQQELVNTWLKHSQTPLIFNLAVKRNGLETKRTVGPESLSDIHDYRMFDLEADFLDRDFPIMAAEILFLEADLAGLPGPIDPSQLRNPDQVAERRTPTYKKALLEAARALFPELTQLELAHAVFTDAALRRKLQDRIVRALKISGSDLPAESFIRDKLPQASIVTPALLSRPAMSAEQVLAELDKLERGEANKFTGATGWIHNNFVGCLLNLYEPHSRACPFYAGFETFCQLSRGNLRHFLELCHKSVTRSLSLGIEFGSPVPAGEQAEAARQASTEFLREIRTFGHRGTQLHTFVLRLGSLFALAHQRSTQSESEQSHFSVGAGAASLTDDDFDFLKEAVKWSVLFEDKATKQKSEYEPESIDYVLNPIYAPFFSISFRKKRKLELTTDETICLMRGSYNEVRDLLRNFSRAWKVEPKQVSPSLFAHLELGATD